MRLIIATLVVVLLTLAGCGTTPAGDAGATGGDPIGAGKAADYDFARSTLSGTAIKGSSLEGEPAVLWFWAPWCPTCRAQSMDVSALAQEYQGKWLVRAWAAWTRDLRSKTWRGDFLPSRTWWIRTDPDRQIWRHLGVTVQSTFTVISTDGEILSEGYLEDAQLNALVEQLAG